MIYERKDLTPSARFGLSTYEKKSLKKKKNWS